MNTAFYSTVAILLYLSISTWIGVRIFTAQRGGEALKYQILSVGVIALSFHLIVLYRTIITSHGMNLGFYNALSLMGWVVAFLVILFGVIRPIENLSLIFLPMAAFALTLELIFPHQHMIIDKSTVGLEMHILLSITAYSLLAIAAVQSFILAIQDTMLRNKNPVRIMGVLPPMQTMEELLVQILAIGFFLLSLSLATGFMFVQNIFDQHLAHKVTLSILAWLIFGLVLFGRWAWGWRGKKLIRWTIGGFLTLMLAYFGSKMVLELILHRV